MTRLRGMLAGNAVAAQPGFEAFASVPLADEGLSCQAAVKGLDPGSEYLFRVAAINKEGASPFSEPGENAVSCQGELCCAPGWW